MELFCEVNYKNALRQRVRELGKTNPQIRLKHLARQIPVQYTYLSKALNDPKTHLNEDHLFSMCQLLSFLPEQTEFVLLLRAWETSQDRLRKKYLHDRIEKIRRSQELSASVREFDSRAIQQEMAYLFDPMCVLIHVALFLPRFRRDPRLLCSAFGLSLPQLHEVLLKLRQGHFIELEGLEKVTEIYNPQIHFGPSHPLMRVHQALLRQVSHSQLQKTAEADKQSFMITFSADAEAQERMRQRFQVFLKDIEKIALEARPESVFQMNFDLFKWA